MISARLQPADWSVSRGAKPREKANLLVSAVIYSLSFTTIAAPAVVNPDYCTSRTAIKQELSLLERSAGPSLVYESM